MFGRATVPAKDDAIPEPGGGGRIVIAKPPPAPHYVPIGILYVKSEKDKIDFRLIYEGHIPQDVKELVAELFGVGSMEWLER
jgi:hypothetical protein